MENKELPSAEEFLKDRAFHHTEDISYDVVCSILEEYAQLVAEYRLEQSLIEANNRMIDQAFKLGIHKQLIESLEMAILNAYKV